jgi:adenylate cyclase
VLVAAFRAHVREAVRRGMLRRTEIEAGHVQGEQDLSVCFADLVGFTRLGGQIEVEELGTVAVRLAELAAEVTIQPVRLVKTIGDAAMFVSREGTASVDAALGLVQAAHEADLPLLRAGIAFGPALTVAGDWYGQSVNLASRVTGVARPGSVLCTEEVRDATAEQFSWSPAGRHRLKNVGTVPLYRPRPLADDATRRRAGRSRRPESS